MAFQHVHECSDERSENRNKEDGREWKLPGDLEEDLMAMVGCFVEVCRRRGLKVNANKSKKMVLGGKEESACETLVNRT